MHGILGGLKDILFGDTHRTTRRKKDGGCANNGESAARRDRNQIVVRMLGVCWGEKQASADLVLFDATLARLLCPHPPQYIEF